MKPLTTSTPHVIIMVGIPGAGKTTFAENFAKTFHAPVVNFNDIAAITEDDGAMTKKVAALLLHELLKTHHTLIYEGPTDTKAARMDITKYITAAGYKPLLVWVQTESMEAKRRATKKSKTGAPLSSEAFDAAIQAFSAPALTENPVVISGKHTYATQLKIILKHLAGSERPEPPTTPRLSPTRNIIVR